MKRFAIIIALVLTFFFYRWVTGPSEEEVVASRLDELASLLEIKNKEEPLERIALANNIATMFTNSVYLELEFEENRVSETKGRNEIRQKTIALRKMLNYLEVAFTDKEISVEGESALAIVTGSALGSMPDIEGQFLEIHRVELELVYEMGSWKISRARHLKSLRE